MQTVSIFAVNFEDLNNDRIFVGKYILLAMSTMH